MTVRRGYLRSPGYPDQQYSSYKQCVCELKTLDGGLDLEILDLSLNHTEAGVCTEDYVEIDGAGSRRLCGLISPERLPQRLHLKTNNLVIKFISDENYEARGFWIQFTGKINLDMSSG